MFKLTKKVPVGVAALCIVSLFGLKDTGVFVNEHVQTTYSGNQIEFAAGEKVEIIEKSDNGYIVSKGKAKVTVPTEKVEIVNGKDIFKVTKNTSIKKDGEVVRNLFIGEELTLEEEKGETIIAKCSDGIIGEVSKDSLDLVFTAKKQPEAVNVSNVKKAETTNVVNAELLKKEEEEIKKAAITKIDKATQVKTAHAVNSSAANVAIDSAMNKLGSRYIYGATGNGGYDCSGLVYSVYRNELGVNVPRSSREQSRYGQQVSKSDLQKGDLIFFNTAGRGVSHVGIYMGDGDFVHASSGQRKVMVSNLGENYYSSRYVNATRVL